MAPLKKKGDLAELKIAADLAERGCKIYFPFGEDSDSDLIAELGDEFHRVQVKHATSDGLVVLVRCRSHSLTNGRVRQTKRYTAASIDWLATFDCTTGRCFYVPAVELGTGRSLLHLRLSAPRNNQRRGIRYASDYENFPEKRIIELRP